jgi:hypothetical protein
VALSSTTRRCGCIGCTYSLPFEAPMFIKFPTLTNAGNSLDLRALSFAPLSFPSLLQHCLNHYYSISSASGCLCPPGVWRGNAGIPYLMVPIALSHRLPSLQVVSRAVHISSASTWTLTVNWAQWTLSRCLLLRWCHQVACVGAPKHRTAVDDAG